ncbi:MAG: PaaI family thioesterase [Fidelibacterota bacterium]
MLPRRFRANLGLTIFGLTKIPMLFYARPSVVAIDDHHIIVKIPLRRRTRNHLGSMYFGALAVGADCAGGFLAMELIQRAGVPVSLVFKDIQGTFLKRPDGDVHFTCHDGDKIKALVASVVKSEERQNLPVNITATVPAVGPERVAQFTLTLSLKKKS